MKYLPLIWAGLWRKRARTIFTLLSIVVAFLLFGMLQGVDAWLAGAVEQSRINRLYVLSRLTFTEMLPISYQSRIETVPGVEMVSHFTWFGGYYQDPRNMVISYPTDARRLPEIYPEWQIPKEQLEALIRTRTGALIGARLAQRYGWKIGDRVPLKTNIWTRKNGRDDWSFDIVGIYTVPENPMQENALLFNFEYFDEARAFGHGMVGWYVVNIEDPAQAPRISAAIDRLFRNSPSETRTQNEKEFAQTQLRQVGDIGFMVNAIVGAVMFTLLFVTGNTMMQSVRERIPELAVLKTIGFSDRTVTLLILTESLLLCVFAALIGLALAVAAFPVMRAVTIMAVSLPAIVLVWGVLAAIALAVVSAAPPAWRANRLSIVEALTGR